MRRVWWFSLLLVIATTYACGTSSDLRQEVTEYLSDYEKTFQELYYEASLAQWETNTHIVEGDTTNAARQQRAKEALAAFVGSVENIERLKGYLENRDRLTSLQVRQLEVMLYRAADQPGIIPDVVSERIAAETEQVEALFGFEFRLNGEPITPNQIDELLRTSNDLEERRAVWEASKEVGPELKSGLVKLRDLRNETVRALDYPDFFTYQVSDYGMTTPEMLELMDELVYELRPLYRELHTWVRYELASRYDEPVPELIPAHWLPDRWAQRWNDLLSVEGLDPDPALDEQSVEWIVKRGEEFYVSLGFEKLSENFYELSSLYPLPEDADYKKNTHASAWHLDLDQDVRSLMSVDTNRRWWGTSLHELGHIYYFMSYTRPEVPLLLREGANRGFHEGIGNLIRLVSLQRQFLVNRGLVPVDAEVDPILQLLQEALRYVVVIQFGAGTMTRYEYALYVEELSPDQLNAKWWELVRRYQGVAPPSPRGEEYADGLTKTHINNDPGQYYDYPISYALVFQLHDHIAKEILGQDPHDTDYWGSIETGDFLREIMEPGMTRPWQELLEDTTGRQLSAQAMVDYFQPLYEWLVEQNQGRTHTLPDL